MKYIHSTCLQYNITSLQQTHNSHPITKPNLAPNSYHKRVTVTRLHSLASTDTDNKQSLQYIHPTHTDRQTDTTVEISYIQADRQTLW